MNRLLKRIAAIFVLLTALANGLTAPLVHAHGPGSGPTREMPEAVSIAVAAVHDHAVECDGAAGDGEAVSHHQPGDHPHGKASDQGHAVCGSGSACCASIVLVNFPVVTGATPLGHWTSLPLLLIGLSPPVGERPPQSPYA